METPTILNKSVNMYTIDDFSEFATLNIKDLNTILHIYYFRGIRPTN